MKNMNKGWITKALALLAAAISPVVMGQTTGSLSLLGSVPVVLEITVNDSPDATTLTPDGSTGGGVSIGTVVEKCNDGDGYTVTVSSLNGTSASFDGGMLAGATFGELLAYDLTYGGAGVGFISGTATVTDSFTKTAADGDSKDILIIYDGSSSNLAADSYSDTLTFTIAAK